MKKTRPNPIWTKPCHKIKNVQLSVFSSQFSSFHFPEIEHVRVGLNLENRFGF